MQLDELTSFRRVTEPAAWLVTPVLAETYLRITVGSEDTLVQHLLEVATAYAEDYTRRALLTQQWQATIDNGALPADGVIDLPRPPLQSVESITYLDDDGASQTLSTSNYTVDIKSEPGRIYFQDMPSIKATLNALTINYTAGYGDAGTDVPRRIQQAVLLMINHFYELRVPIITNATAVRVPLSANALLDTYKISYL